jgi:hypothetical protein
VFALRFFACCSEGALKIMAETTDPFAIDAVAIPLTALPLLEQPRSLQTMKMLGDRSLRKWKGFNNPAAGRFATFL